MSGGCCQVGLLLCDRGEHRAGVHVEPGQQGERAVPDVFVFDPYRLAGRGGQGLAAAPAGLDRRLGVEEQDAVMSPT